MGEFEDMLNNILSSPKDMEKIMGLARELTGGGEDSPKPQPEPSGPKPGARGNSPGGGGLGDLGGLDPKLIGVVTRLMGELKHDRDDKTALVQSMKPYVRPERREALDRAVKLTKLAHVAKIAMSELGGDLDLGL